VGGLPLSSEGGDVDLVATLLNTFVVVGVGAVLTYLTNDRFKTLRREMAELRTELKADIARVELRLDAGVAAVRSDIVQVSLAVGAGRGAAQG
jgi:hypothetical protein